jgi:beta-lactam-binding protein with PASTA domain
MNWKETILWKDLHLRVAVLGIISLLVLFILFDWVIMPVVTRHGKECTVPLIVGMNLEDAKVFLKRNKLKLVVLAEESNAQRPVGTILIQNPETGKTVKQGRNVRVIISKGGERVEIPNLSGISLRQAELTLAQTGLEVGDVNWILSDSFPENVVVSSIPLPGLIVPQGISVNLLVSQGRLYDVVMMPKLVGKNLEQAQKIADSLKLEIGQIKYRYRGNFLPGIVVHQTPESGTKLEAGSKIRLEVSSTE